MLYTSCDDTSIFKLYDGPTRNGKEKTGKESKDEEVLIRPKCTIGDISTPCSLSRRIYIQQGASCPICFEGMWKCSDARLLSCGHSFHLSCLKNAYNAKMKQKPNSVFGCPMCRIPAHEMLTDIDMRYNLDAPDFNGLDALENAQDEWRALLPATFRDSQQNRVLFEIRTHTRPPPPVRHHQRDDCDRLAIFFIVFCIVVFAVVIAGVLS